MDDVVVEIVGQQRLRQLAKKTLQDCRWNMNVTELVKIHHSTCTNRK